MMPTISAVAFIDVIMTVLYNIWQMPQWAWLQVLANIYQ